MFITMLFRVLTGDLPFDADFVIDTVCAAASIEPRAGLVIALDNAKCADGISFALEDKSQNRIILIGRVDSQDAITITARCGFDFV